MPTIKSLDDLKRVKEEASKKLQLKPEPGSAQIIVGIGTPSIAAGVQETLKAILETIEEKQLKKIIIRQTGNIGLDSWEPVVQVIVGEHPKVTYGRVNPAAARRIMQEHVLNGQVVKEYVIEVV
jgi:NADP-reducing hydrogenase subunit HndB